MGVCFLYIFVSLIVHPISTPKPCKAARLSYRAAKEGTHETDGWASSAYANSKLAINLITSIQQREFDRDQTRPDIVVNAVSIVVAEAAAAAAVIVVVEVVVSAATVVAAAAATAAVVVSTAAD